MKFSHREEQRGDRLLDVLTDEENGLRLIVSRLGAEMVSLARRHADEKWIGFLYRDNDITAPAKGWANHATVMGYYLHRLKGERSLYRGKEIKGGTHSFLRHKVFSDVEVNAGETASLTYRISPNEFTKTEYPLKVSLALRYELSKAKLGVTFHFQNAEPELTAHVAFGLHPGFAATSFDSFRFQMPAGKYRRHFSPDNFLSGETEDIEFQDGEMPFDRSKLPGSYILELLDVKARVFTYEDPPSGRRISLDFNGVPYLTLWSDGSAFLCVEPCWGLTDHHEQRAFEDKEGMQTIPAGGGLRARFTIDPWLEAKP
jgi:galactose mutarotase-like enzyme